MEPIFQAPLDYLFAGASSLAEQLDRDVMVILRDGRHLIGKLASYDHFGSIILEDARERHFASGGVCDLPMGGLYLIRGENVALLGEMRDAGAGPALQERSWEEVSAAEQSSEEAFLAARALGASTGGALEGMRAASTAPSVGATLWSCTE